MTWITDALASLFNTSGLICFVMGLVLGRVWCWLSDRVQDVRDPFHRPHHTGFRSLTTLWSLLFIIVSFLGFQQREQRIGLDRQQSEIMALKTSVENCQREFQRGVIIRDETQAEINYLAKLERKALADWLKAIVIPPPNIAELHTTDPMFQQYTLNVTQEWLHTLQSIETQRSSQEDKLAKNPLPEIKCGK